METQLETSSAEPGVIEFGGNRYMTDPQGHLVPLERMKPQHLLEDQTVRKILGFAEDLSAQVRRFRGHTFDDVVTFMDLLSERYGGKRGGAKGNITLTQFDGLGQVRIQVQDQLSFGPELQVAKELVDDCIAAWSESASAELRTLVQHAFQTDKEGKINRAALFQLRRVEIDKAPWPQAMEALSDAICVIGSREYCRFYKRANARAKWEAITIDLASA